MSKHFCLPVCSSACTDSEYSIHCKHAAFCKDCEPYDERPIIYERPVIDKEGFKSGRTCSLGPDQSIDCNALNDPKYRRVNVFEWEH